MVAFIGGFGGQEVLLILGIALVIFGPKRIPSLARSLGKFSAQIRAANRQIQREIYSNIDPEEIQREGESTRLSGGTRKATARSSEFTGPDGAVAVDEVKDPYADLSDAEEARASGDATTNPPRESTSWQDKKRPADHEDQRAESDERPEG